MPRKENKLKGHKRTVGGVSYTYNISFNSTDTHADLIKANKRLEDEGYKTKVYYGKVGTPTGTKEKPTRIYVVKRSEGTPKRKKRQVDNITKWKAKVKGAIRRNHPSVSVSSRKGEEVGNVLEGETKTRIFTAFFNENNQDRYSISIYDYYPNTSDANYMKGKTYSKDANVNTVANFIVSNMGLRKKRSKHRYLKTSQLKIGNKYIGNYTPAGYEDVLSNEELKNVQFKVISLLDNGDIQWIINKKSLWSAIKKTSVDFDDIDEIDAGFISKEYSEFKNIRKL